MKSHTKGTVGHPSAACTPAWGPFPSAAGRQDSHTHKLWWMWTALLTSSEVWPWTLTLAPGPVRHPVSLKQFPFLVKQLQPAWLSWRQTAFTIIPSRSPGRLRPAGVRPCRGEGAGNVLLRPDVAFAKPSNPSVGLLAWPERPELLQVST